MERAGTGLRAVRAAVFAAVCVTMSATTHILVSHAPLPLPVVLGAAVGVFAAAYALGSRERGFVAIAVALTPLELAADTVFNSGQRTCYGPDGGPVTGSWHSLHEAIVCHGAPVGGSLANNAPAPAAGFPVSPWLLLGAHVVVGLIAACVLRRGEAWLYRSMRTAFRPLLVALAVLRPAVTAEPAPRADGTAPAAPALPHLLHSVVRRGPPVMVAA
jgi:hypothetical protein